MGDMALDRELGDLDSIPNSDNDSVSGLVAGLVPVLLLPWPLPCLTPRNPVLTLGSHSRVLPIGILEMGAE